MNLLAAGPDVTQIHILAALAFAHGFGHQVLAYRAGNGVRHHQRRTGQEVGLDIGVNARLEVAITRKHGRADQIVLRDGGIDLGCQITGIANAGGATIAGKGKAQLFQIRQQTCLCQIARHQPRAGGQRGFDMRLDLEPCLHRLFGQQARRQHDTGVGGVGTAGDGRNQHVAAAHIKALAACGGAACINGNSAGLGLIGRGLVAHHLDFVALGIGRHRLAVWLQGLRPIGMHKMAASQLLGRQVEAILRNRCAEQFIELSSHIANLDTVLWPLGTSQARRDLAKIQLDHMGVVNIARLGDAEQILSLEVGLEGLDFALGAARALEVLDGFLIDGEKAHGRAVFRCHIANRGPVGKGEAARAFAKEFDKFADHFFLAQNFRDREHQVGRRHAFAQLAGQLEAHHIRREEVHGLAQHGGFRLDAAHPPGHDANAVDHGGVAVGTDQRIGVIDAILGLVHATRQILEVDLVNDAEPWRHHAKGVKGLHAPFHELVALLVALKLQLHVQVQRLFGAEVINHDGVIDHQIHRYQRLDGLGLLAQLGRRAAHGRQIGQQGHAGKVLQHHARDNERNFIDPLSFRLCLPARQLLNMGCGDFLAVAVAQH